MSSAYGVLALKEVLGGIGTWRQRAGSVEALAAAAERNSSELGRHLSEAGHGALAHRDGGPDVVLCGCSAGRPDLHGAVGLHGPEGPLLLILDALAIRHLKCGSRAEKEGNDGEDLHDDVFGQESFLRYVCGGVCRSESCGPLIRVVMELQSVDQRPEPKGRLSFL